MATATTRSVAPVTMSASGRLAQRSVYDWVPDGIVNNIFFRVLLLVAPIQSVLLTPVQGSTAAYLMVLLSPAILIGSGQRYLKLLTFIIAFVILYSIYMALSLGGNLIDEPNLTGLTVIRKTFVYGYLRQTNITQGVYLLSAVTFAYLVYDFWQESFVKFMFYGILLLVFYGFYEFIFYAIFHINGDILSNRNFGDLNTAAAGAGQGSFATGSTLQQSNLFGPAFMRLKSLTGEPSMYALSTAPFAIYAFGRRWWWLFGLITLSLVLSTSSTGLIGLLIGLTVVEIRQRQEAILYITAAVLVVVLLYATADGVHDGLNKVLFQKMDTFSGASRLRSFTDHAGILFDGNPVRALFGLGFGTVRSTDMLSNLLANVGLLGLLLYSALILGPCFLLRGVKDQTALIAALVAIFAMEMLTVSEYGYLPPWFMVAFGYVRARQFRTNPRAT